MFKVLLVGDAAEDIYHYGTIDRLCPEAPVPVLRHTHTEKRDGMCLNVRNNLQTFDIEVEVLCNSEPLLKKRFIDLKTKQHLLRADFGETHRLNQCHPNMIEKYDFDEFDAVVIADYDKGFVGQAIVDTIRSKARESNIRIFVDSKKKDLRIYEDCIVKINELEYSKLKNVPLRCDLIVTMGEHGAKWNGNVYPTEACDVFDVCGAGDTFLAALVAEHLNTDSIDESIKFANKCARIVVGKFGTYTLTPKDVRDIKEG